MIWALLLAAQASVEISAAERSIAAMIVLAPGASDLALPARVIEAAASAWREDTGLRVLDAEQRGIVSAEIALCPAKRLLGCALARSARIDADVLVIASALELGEGRVQLASWLIELATARRIAEELGDDEATRENRLYLSSIVKDAELDANDAAALAEYFRAMRPEMARALPSAEGLGSFSLELPWEARGLTLDGRSLGDPRADRILVLDAKAGQRRVAAVDAEGRRHELELLVRPGRTTRASLEAGAGVPLPDDYGLERRALAIAGLAFAIGGGALAISSGALGGGVRYGCLGRGSEPPSCASLGAPSFAFDASAAPTTDPSRVDPGGLAPLPLGLALLGAGATWGVGALLSDDKDAPWTAVVLGLVVGGLGYGVAAAVN